VGVTNLLWVKKDPIVDDAKANIGNPNCRTLVLSVKFTHNRMLGWEKGVIDGDLNKVFNSKA
jgi:hypothetical protein